MAKKVRERIIDTALGRKFITWEEKKVWEDYMKYCEKAIRKAAKNDRHMNADIADLVTGDLRRLRSTLGEYDREKGRDPRGQKAMAVRLSVACLAADMPYTGAGTGMSVKEAVDKVHRMKMNKGMKLAGKLGFTAMGPVATGVAGAGFLAFGLIASAVAAIGQYMIEFRPHRTDDDFMELTGALQEAYASLGRDALKEGFYEDLVAGGACKLSSDGRILIADDEGKARKVAEFFRDELEGTEIPEMLDSGKEIPPEMLEKMLNRIYKGRLPRATEHIGSQKATADLSEEFAGSGLNSFIRSWDIRQNDSKDAREIGA